MSAWIFSLVSMGLLASLTALAVLAVRPLLRPVLGKYTYFLWAAVFFRAICPVSFSAPVSLIGLFGRLAGNLFGGGKLRQGLTAAGTARGIFEAAAERAGETAGAVGTAAAGTIAEGAGALAETTGGVLADSGQASPDGWIFAFAVLWAVGTAAFLGYGLVSWLRLRRRTAFAVRCGDYFESDGIGLAFVSGFFRPGIYLPAGMTGRERELVLAHERAHLRWQDSRVKMLAWLIAVLHWMNPVMWLAFALLARDMELSCDERVLEQLGEESKREYGSFLLSLASPERMAAGSPVAFGENSVRARIRRIVKYRRRGRLASAGAVAAALALLAFCAANPSQNIAVIGGADGPTSVFVAGKTDESAGQEAEALLFFRGWAEAVGSRNAAYVYAALSPELQARAEELGIFTESDGSRTMGWSSPFWAGMVEPVIVLLPKEGQETGESGQRARITYPAQTSDPLWWVWKDEVTAEKTEDGWQVTEWNSRTFFEISSAADFAEAYRDWQPDYLNLPDYQRLPEEKSFGEWLVQNDLEGESPAYYGTEFDDPVRALELTLHVSGGVGQVSGEEGSAEVIYSLPDGELRVRMTQPGRERGSSVWVPEQIGEGSVQEE
ncbi:MAG: M56 family metallopeptidase [Eubacteriales bacterium]|nr:M56 family metallopeptidase [Eubacteriales bacterium]